MASHTIRELIDAANQDPRRGVGHTKVLTRLECDDGVVEFLARVRAHTRQRA